MQRLSALFVLAVALLLQQTLADKSCMDLGFTGEQSCSDCESFAEFVKDEELVADCKKCCVREEVKKYSKAVLEVCQYRINSLPQIKDFIEKTASKYPNLQVSYSYGASPKLRLSGGPGGASETLRIDNWKASNIVGFLNERLDTAAL